MRVNFACSSIFADELPTSMLKSPGSALHPAFFTSKNEKDRRSSFTDTRLLSPGLRFTLPKPFSSFTGRGTLLCESETYTSATYAPSREPVFLTEKETITGALTSEEAGVTVRALY